MLSPVEQHSEFKSALTDFIELLSKKKCESQLDWQVRCTLPKQMDRMDTRVDCPKKLSKMCSPNVKLYFSLRLTHSRVHDNIRFNIEGQPD